MDYRYKQLEQDLSALSNVFIELGSRLSEASKEVTASGVLPSEKLIEQILTARASFESVRSAVHSQAGSMLVSPLPKAEELGSIQAIGALLKTATSAEESKFSAQGEQDRATDILSRVLAITHREMAAFPPLQECHAKVAELRSAISKVAWPNRHPEAESVIGLRHPATILLNFVENLDSLEDDKWMALEATITEAYGKPLFVAASRGKLVAQQSPGKSPEPAKHAPAAEKPVEKKSAPEKLSEKTGVAAHVEKKHALPAVEVAPPAPVHAAHTPTAPIPVAPAAVAQTPVAPVQAAPAPAPPALTPITSTTIPTRPPAPISAPPTVAAAAPPAPASASSLSALANATDPATERKPAVHTSSTENAEKGRKEPRLAAPAPPQAAQAAQPARPEPTAQDQEQMGDEASRAMAGDGSQRPQRWGFWRGNR